MQERKFISTNPTDIVLPKNWRNLENVRYGDMATLIETLRSGRDVYWRGIVRKEPQVLRGFMRWFASNLEGNPPPSLILAEELKAQQDFLNGRSAQTLVRASIKEIRDQKREIDPMAYLLERAGISISAADLFAAMQLHRRIPWERDIPGASLLAFLQELKQLEEEATSEKLLPLSMWNQHEFQRSFTFLPGPEPLVGLLGYLRREGKKKGVGPIAILQEKTGISPTVEEFIEAIVLGKQITRDQFTPAIVSGLLAKAADELGIDASAIKITHLDEHRFSFLGNRPLHQLVHYAKQSKLPTQSPMDFLQYRAHEPEIRRQKGRVELLKRAKRIGDLHSTNGGVLTYAALERSGLFEELGGFFESEEEFLYILKVQRPHTVYPARQAAETSKEPQQVLRLISAGKWYEAANCRDMDTNNFVSIELSDSQITKAKTICETCPVQGHCELWGQQTESYGVWGGKTDVELEKIRKSLKRKRPVQDNWTKYLEDLPHKDIANLQKRAGTYMQGMDIFSEK